MPERQMFQSTPVIANGRIPMASDAAGGLDLFQSTPVIANGRIRWSKRRSGRPSRFQSTPVIANGRINAGWPDCRCGNSFNPRPLLLTGESCTADTDWRWRRCGFNPRPLLLTGESRLRRAPVGAIQSFNPRPLLLTGESAVAAALHPDVTVSIHARYC